MGVLVDETRAVRSVFADAHCRRSARRGCSSVTLPSRCISTGRDLVMPLSHDLPVYRGRDTPTTRGIWVGWWPPWTHIRPGATIVDIGANVGDSAAIMRAQVPGVPILCIEGDAHSCPICVTTCTGSPERRSQRCTCSSRPNPMVRWLSFVPAAPLRWWCRRIQVWAKRSQPSPSKSSSPSIPDFANPGLIKLDTDGHDADILLQAESVLREAQPVVFLRVRSADGRRCRRRRSRCRAGPDGPHRLLPCSRLRQHG